MNTFFFQTVFFFFALGVIAHAVRQKRRGLLTARGVLFWVCVWLSAVAVVLWPQVTTRIANRFGIGRGTDFVVYIALAAMFFLLLRLHIKIEIMNRDVTAVVRRNALDERES